jgi:adenylate kinase
MGKLLSFFLLGSLLLSAQPRPQVLAILGPPGSGKSTQANELRKKLRLPVVSIDDIINAEFGPKSDEARALRGAMDSGHLQRIDAVNDMIQRRFELPDLKGGCIIDGYPRTASQAAYLDALLTKKGLPAARVIVLDVPDAEALRRMTKRGGADDKPEIMQQLLADYHREIDAVTAHFKDRLFKVNGNQPPAAVTAELLKVVAK